MIDLTLILIFSFNNFNNDLYSLLTGLNYLSHFHIHQGIS